MKLNVTDRDGALHELEFKAGDVLMHVLYDAELGLAPNAGAHAPAPPATSISATPTRAVCRPAPAKRKICLTKRSRLKTLRLSCQVYLDAQHDGMALTIAPDWE